MTDTLLFLESRLRKITLDIHPLLTNCEATRHLGGFVSRHYMMQTSRIFLEGKFDPEKRNPMSAYETTDCMIHINGYYMNLRGSLDNLSWILQYQRQILGGLSEAIGGRRQSCYIFSKEFKKHLPAFDQKLADFLLTKEQWSKDFSELRDPAAHRIPITISRSVLLGEDAKKKFEEIMKGLPTQIAAGKSHWEIYAEADAFGVRLPIMILQQADGKLEPRPLLLQLWQDHLQHIEISSEILKSFIPASS
jgi:hypothetical protein